MVINVSESVLLDVGNTDVLVLVDLATSGDKFTSQDVDEGRLAGTVGPNDGNTGAERALEGDVGKLGLGGTSILEGHLGGTENSLSLGLDTLKETWLREAELDLRSAELVVRLGRRNTLDELLQVTTVALELEALVVNDVLADVVKEARVVRDDDGSARGVNKVLLEPLNILDVQVVGRLIEQQDIGSLEDSTAQGKLHLPTTRKGGDFTLDHGVGEAELVELLLDIGLSGLDTSLLELLHGPVNGGHLSVSGVKVVLDEDSLDFALLGETLDLLVVDGAHESRLSGTVGTAKTVALTTLKAKVSLVKKNLGTVGEREGAIAQILTLLLIGLSLLSLSGVGGRTLADGVDDAFSVVNTRDHRDVRLQVVDPDGGLLLLLVDNLTSNCGNVLDDRGHLLDVSGVLGAEDVLDLGEDDVDGTIVASLGDNTILDVTDTGKGLESLLGLLTSFGISQVLVVLLETWHHLGQERSDNVGVVDKLAHVVNNDGRLSLDGSLTLSETTVKKRDHESEGGLLDLSDEGGGTEQVNGLRDVLGLGDTLDQLRNETLNITVDDELAELLHGLVGTLLDVLLGIPHSLRDDGNQLRDTVSKLGGGGDDESVDEVKSSHLLLPLLGAADGLHDGGERGLDTVAVDGTSDGEDSSGGGVLDSGDLVTDGSQKGREDDSEVRLNVSRDLGVGGNGLDGDGGLLTGTGILLVGEALGQVVEEARETKVS